MPTSQALEALAAKYSSVAVRAALFTSAPADDDTPGTEVSGGSYARLTPVWAAGLPSTFPPLTFQVPAGTTVAGAGLYDASGKYLGGAALPAQTYANAGQCLLGGTYNVTSPGFILGTTRPEWYGTGDVRNNVGCLAGVSRTTVAASSLNFSTNNQTFSNLNIGDNIVTVTGSGHTFYNCRFTYNYTGTGTGGGMVMAQDASVSGLTFDHCEFEPNGTNYDFDGFYGHDATFTRCAITHTVDGLGFYNSNKAAINGTVKGCWIGQNSWYDQDNVHSDGTHNDGIQNGSGNTVWVEGCFWQGAKYNALNPANVTVNDDQTFTVQNGNGTHLLNSSANNLWPQQAQIYLGSADAYYPVDNITFINNWVWNFDAGIMLSVDGNLAQGTGTPIHATIKGNRFGGKPRDYGYTYHYYPIRYDTGCIVNGVQQSSATQFLDTWGNSFDASASVVTTYGNGVTVAGQPVYHRVDAA